MFFHGWASIGRGVLLATCVYLVLLAALRVLGARALAKMSAYDLVVTIALGSLIASIPLTEQISLADGLAVIATYLLLQYALSWWDNKSKRVRRAVKEHPHVVLWEGRLLQEALDRVKVTEEEVRAAVRSAGHGSLGDIQAVVLENDGQWSVVPRAAGRDLSAFEGLDIPADDA
ncbi:MAG TPA: YetF domain-containing protein [Vicinamibacterales bacterium]|nr:YetF domain-containing protein [Vicinamibacterales bacterium]